MYILNVEAGAVMTLDFVEALAKTFNFVESSIGIAVSPMYHNKQCDGNRLEVVE